MRLELAISLRYLRSRRSDAAVSFVTTVALLGVTLGVAACQDDDRECRKCAALRGAPRH